MKKTTAFENEDIVTDAEALLTATANVAEEKVVEARKRLMAAIAKGQEAWHAVQEKAVAGAKVADQTIRDHPYQSIGVAAGVAAGVGALIGFLIGRRN